MIQTEKIKQLLNQSEWVCGRVFLGNYISEYRTRINELRKQGFKINTRKCQSHKHKGGMQEWKLEVGKIYKGIAETVVPTPGIKCCYSYLYFKIHGAECRAGMFDKQRAVNKLF